MLAVYIFCLVLGGGFLAVSLLGGVLGGVADAELELGGDADVDVSDSLDTQAAKIFSLRTAVYGLFGFGGVGFLLTYLGAGSALMIGLYAALGGIASGGLATALFNWVRATESGESVRDDRYVGLAGTMSLPITGRAPGTVIVEYGGRRVSLRALPHGTDDSDPEGWRSVVVIDMQDGVARVVPAPGELAPPPDD